MESSELLEKDTLDILNEVSIKNGRDPRSDAFLDETKKLLEIFVNNQLDFNCLAENIYEELEKRYFEGFEDGENMFKDKMESISDIEISELGQTITNDLLLILVKNKFITSSGKKTVLEIGKNILNLTANMIRKNL